jgi:hypothetical protein
MRRRRGPFGAFGKDGRWSRAAAALGILLAGTAIEARALADVVYELAPTVGGGATSNVYTYDYNYNNPADPAAASRQRFDASFTTVGGTMRLRHKGNRFETGLGIRAIYTQYLVAGAPNMFSGNLAWDSAWKLDALWTLRLLADATFTRTNGNDFGDPATIIPHGQLAAPVSVYYLTADAAEDVSYEPSPRRGYGENFSVSQLRYFQNAQDVQNTQGGMFVPLPTTDVFALALRANRMMARENYTLQAALGDAYTETDPAVGVVSEIPGHNFYGRALLGWGHEYSPYWSTLLQAGPAVMFRVDGTGAVVAPAGTAAVNYRRVPWYASLSAIQTPAPDLYLGGAILTDQVMARVALPLSKSELFFIGGYGGYTYARMANRMGDLQRNYDQFMGGVSLYGRMRKFPLTGGITYVAISQRGNASPTMSAPDLAMQTVFVSLSSNFAWGPGTPPLFGGPL